MKVVAQLEIPGDVVMVGAPEMARLYPAALMKTGPGLADLYLAGVKVGDQAMIVSVDADRVYEAGKEEPTGAIVHKVVVSCVVDFGPEP